MLNKIKSLIAVAIISVSMIGICSNTYAEENPKVMMDSWYQMYQDEDSQIREMFDIYDTNISPSIRQRILYQLSKPFTDAMNILQGENVISYGGGGHILRDWLKIF